MQDPGIKDVEVMYPKIKGLKSKRNAPTHRAQTSYALHQGPDYAPTSPYPKERTMDKARSVALGSRAQTSSTNAYPSINVHVTLGAYKRKSWSFPAYPALRPTAHRVRQSILNTLIHRFDFLRDEQNAMGTASQPLAGLKVMDVFAGTGMYAIEALSLGAKQALCIDVNAKVLEDVRAFTVRLGCQDRLSIFVGAWPTTLPNADRISNSHSMDAIGAQVHHQHTPQMDAKPSISVDTAHPLQGDTLRATLAHTPLKHTGKTSEKESSLRQLLELDDQGVILPHLQPLTPVDRHTAQHPLTQAETHPLDPLDLAKPIGHSALQPYFLQQIPKVHIIFMDPPYALTEPELSTALRTACIYLEPGGVIVLEHPCPPLTQAFDANGRGKKGKKGKAKFLMSSPLSQNTDIPRTQPLSMHNPEPCDKEAITPEATALAMLRCVHVQHWRDKAVAFYQISHRPSDTCQHTS